MRHKAAETVHKHTATYVILFILFPRFIFLCSTYDVCSDQDYTSVDLYHHSRLFELVDKFQQSDVLLLSWRKVDSINCF